MMLAKIKEKLFLESNLQFEDKPWVFKKIIENPQAYLSWNDVEECVNNPIFYEFDLIDKFGKKVDIPKHKKAWVFNKLVSDKKFIFEKINQGYTLIINNYGYQKQNCNELLQMLENLFYTDATMHVYCGLETSNSFTVHEDIPSNIIFQIEGKTKWTVYENRSSSLVASGYRPSEQETFNFTPALEVVLEPGDILHIPSRAYHVAEPQGKRLSISIPCWPKFNEPLDYSIDRNYYKINH